MRKTLLVTAMTGLSLSLALPTYAATTGNLEQRVNRLERMMDNPVLLQLSRRLGEQQRDIQSLQDENDRLKRELRNIHALMDKRYKESDERLSVLEGKTPKTASMSVPENDSSSVQETLQDEVEDQAQTQPGEMQTVAQENAQSTQQATTSNVDSSVPSDKQVAVLETQSAGSEKQGDESKVIHTRPATDIEKEKYKDAFAEMRASKYDKSIASFESFIKQYPESELASNAAYWSGEGYLIKGDNQKALDSFLMVIQRYPNSTKVPDATLRAGDSYSNLGDNKKAEALYKQIIESRPSSRAAQNAQKRLEKQ
ncbi:tol-pal system protein YbgF [Thiomicrorhabdus sp.]|uniref:tol-pal system protein YbgF n=1 Tax=Thiomicrorhabdus sp. TaxID=2039724 RepID=UPI002AA8381F|nr:tol-pal system protein YbgF [Thiomicrorhabdus sp.]